MTRPPALAPAVRDAAMRWIADDPDPASRDELQRLLAAAMAGGFGGAAEEAAEQLAGRMAGPLRFGTAGLRGPVRAGPAGMNVAVVRRATAGLADWLAARGHAGGLVVVGRDARRGSARFAAATAEVLAGAGFEVRALAEPLPTPVLAHAVRALDAVAGVQITASHNPPADNGYKVYLGGDDGGAQLVEPADAQIEAAIAAAPAAVSIPTATVPPTDPTSLLDGYLARTAALPRGTERSASETSINTERSASETSIGTARELRIALTPMHGVGGAVAVRALRAAGFEDVHLVPSQAEPDPTFPTVPFPNPEEPGATDALLALAAEIDADLAVALDPDADRCALAVPDPDATGGWRMLTGDETGVLLGEYLLTTLNRDRNPDPLVATTVASSTQLRAIAAAHGARFAQTLTGFKWIVRAGGDGRRPDPGFVYGYEEAIGYCVDPGTARDKDGIAAAVLAADLAATRRAGGGSLLTALDELALAHGVYLTDAITVPMPRPGTESSAGGTSISAILARLTGADEKPAPDVYVMHGERTRTVVRPSGTEPKLKAYLEVVEPVSGPDELAAVRAHAAERLATLRAEVDALLTH